VIIPLKKPRMKLFFSHYFFSPSFLLFDNTREREVDVLEPNIRDKPWARQGFTFGGGCGLRPTTALSFDPSFLTGNN
jgi:hypothetical protein